MQSFSKPILEAIESRQSLIKKLNDEGTNAYRLFHGVNEGIPGLTIDRYGPLIIIQTFRDSLLEEDYSFLKEILTEKLNSIIEKDTFSIIYNHRGKEKKVINEKFKLSEIDLKPKVFKESNIKYIIKARHRSLEPLLFLDMRAGRKYFLKNSANKNVLNLFSYTCGTGLAALKGGAKEVWNIDFSESSLNIGQQNAELNNLNNDSFKVIKADVFLALRKLNNIPLKGRLAGKKHSLNLPEKQFDLVFLDPPKWAKSPFGTVDLIRDYQSIFKLSLLATKEGGTIIAVNNVAKVDLEDWLIILKKCAEKAGRKIKEIEVIEPESDFPSPDKKFPLKIAVCQV